jgi:hypothetical protein
VQPGDDATRAMTVILRKLAGFSGLLHENMYRFTGWRFLEIGRRIERAIQIARTLAHVTDKDAPDGALDMMLEIGDSVMTHRAATVTTGATVVDLLVLDKHNALGALPPDRIRDQWLPPGRGRLLSPLSRAACNPHRLAVESRQRTAPGRLIRNQALRSHLTPTALSHDLRHPAALPTTEGDHGSILRLIRTSRVQRGSPRHPAPGRPGAIDFFGNSLG